MHELLPFYKTSDCRLSHFADLKISFGDLYLDKGKTLLELFNMAADDSDTIVQVLSQSTVSIEKVKPAQTTLITEEKLGKHSLTC